MIRVASIQRAATQNCTENIEECYRLAKKAVAKMPGLDLIIFPECNNGAVTHPSEAVKLAQTMDGEFVTAFRDIAKELNVNIHTGSFIEAATERKTFNTLAVINRQGEIAGKYSKTHLFDALGTKESNYVVPGDNLGLIDLDFGKIGVAICYDMRFPELLTSMALKGADFLCVSAFWPCGNNFPPRSDQWDILSRAAAIQNLCYVVTCNQYGAVSGSYPFGRSAVINPWGTVVAHADEGTCVVCHELDMDYQKQVREGIGSFNNRRPDIYLK